MCLLALLLGYPNHCCHYHYPLMRIVKVMPRVTEKWQQYSTTLMYSHITEEDTSFDLLNIDVHYQFNDFY